MSIYKSFIRPHLDYADIIYDQPHNQSLSDRIESVQYNAALAITGAIRRTSRERLYQELGLESLSNRRWYRRLTMFFNIASGNCPNYLTNILPTRQTSYNTERNNLYYTYRANTDYFKNSFFPCSVNEWNKLDSDIRNSKSISIFKKSLLGFIPPKSYSIFNINDPKGIKYLTRLRLNFSHLRQHKFRHNFQDTLNPLCSCSLETESVNHFLLRCHFFVHARKTLLDNLVEIIGDISNISESKLVNIFLYGNENFNGEINATILKNTIIFLKESERFDMPLIGNGRYLKSLYDISLYIIYIYIFFILVLIYIYIFFFLSMCNASMLGLSNMRHQESLYLYFFYFL